MATIGHIRRPKSLLPLDLLIKGIPTATDKILKPDLNLDVLSTIDGHIYP